MKNRPDIFRYHDYQDFLKDWLAYLKASQLKFSMRKLAKQASLATGYLPMVLNGKRPLSSAQLAKLLPFLGLNNSEASFLECLLILGTSDSHEARLRALERMKRFHRYRAQNPDDSIASEYLTHWYYVAIRELATTSDFQIDPKWVQDQLQFPVPLDEVKMALEFLIKAGYVQVDADGRAHAIDKVVNCSGGIYRLALAKFHREMCDLLTKSIDTTPSVLRNIQGHTVSLNRKNLDEAKAIVEEAIGKLRELGSSDSDGDCVYHMEVGLFPLTKQRGSK